MIMNVEVSMIMIKALKRSAGLFFLRIASSSDQTRKNRLLTEKKIPGSQFDISE